MQTTKTNKIQNFLKNNKRSEAPKNIKFSDQKLLSNYINFLEYRFGKIDINIEWFNLNDSYYLCRIDKEFFKVPIKIINESATAIGFEKNLNIFID